MLSSKKIAPYLPNPGLKICLNLIVRGFAG